MAYTRNKCRARLCTAVVWAAQQGLNHVSPYRAFREKSRGDHCRSLSGLNGPVRTDFITQKHAECRFRRAIR